MGKLEGKVVLITGCASGLGKQQAIRMAEEGAKFAICSRTESKLMETKRICEEKGAEVLAMAIDIMEYDSLEKFVDATAKKFGTIDVLVNNAHTITRPAPFLEKTIEDLDVEMRSSVYAYWHLMKLCFPYLRDKSGAGCSIINFASEAAVAGDALYAPYAASKEAVRGLSRVVAREWGQYNIRINTLCPNGLTDNCSGGFASLGIEAQMHIEKSFVNNPFHRAGDPYNDVAPIVIFLASDDSHWMTGQNIHADGGGWITAQSIDFIKYKQGNVTPHWFRHYFAQEAHRSGAPLLFIQNTLGHKKVTTTEIYLKEIMKKENDAAQYIDEKKY